MTRPKTLIKNEAGFSVLIILLLLAVLMFAGIVSYRTLNASKKQVGTDYKLATTKGEIVNSVEIQSDSIYKAELVDGITYYGMVNKIDDAFVRISSVYYLQEGVLIALGNELHGPEKVLYATKDSILSLEPLALEDEAYKAIKQYEETNGEAVIDDAYPSSDINDYIKPDQFQAFIFKSSPPLYAKSGVLKAKFLKDNLFVFAISSVDGELGIEKLNSEEYADYEINELIYWENMKNNSQITQAINKL